MLLRVGELLRYTRPQDGDYVIAFSKAYHLQIPREPEVMA
jgi:hypothetical protein